MTQSLAFRLAQPIERFATSAEAEGIYDPSLQAVVWTGGDRPAAVRCTAYTPDYTGGTQGCPRFEAPSRCNAYGNYCDTWRRACTNTAYRCDR